MSTPEYSGRYDRKMIFRGDTLKSFKMLLEVDSQPIAPVDVCAQLRTKRGELVHTFGYQVDPITGVVTIEGVQTEITRDWRPGEYVYDVQYTLASGVVRTYLFGSLTVKKDISRCQ